MPLKQKKTRRELEHKHQCALFEWARLNQGLWPELRWMHTVPNGGARHPAVAAKMKKEGQKSGVVDIFLDVPRAGFHGLRIELKYGKGTPTDNQERWIEHYRRSGYYADVFWSWEDAAAAIKKYLAGQQTQEWKWT